MMKWLKNAAAILAILVTVVGVLLPLEAIAGQTADCYNYTPNGYPNDCVIDHATILAHYCKELTQPPFNDPGCCSYDKEQVYWKSAGPGHICPQPPSLWNINADNHTDLTCFKSDGSDPPPNTDVVGNCY